MKAAQRRHIRRKEKMLALMRKITATVMLALGNVDVVLSCNRKNLWANAPVYLREREKGICQLTVS